MVFNDYQKGEGFVPGLVFYVSDHKNYITLFSNKIISVMIFLSEFYLKDYLRKENVKGNTEK